MHAQLWAGRPSPGLTLAARGPAGGTSGAASCCSVIASPTLPCPLQEAAGESLSDALQLVNYQNMRGGRAMLKTIPMPDSEYASDDKGAWPAGVEWLWPVLQPWQMAGTGRISLLHDHIAVVDCCQDQARSSSGIALP